MENLINVLTNNAALIWIVISAVFILLESFFLPEIGFLFAAIGAFTTGIIIYSDIISADNFLVQLLSFAVVSAVLALTFWRYISRIFSRTKEIKLKVGTTAIVINEALKKGLYGTVKWQGKVVTARICKTSDDDHFPIGEEVEVINIHGTILTVNKKKKNEISGKNAESLEDSLEEDIAINDGKF